MSQILELTQKLQRELYSKNKPGEIILNLREKILEKFIQKYECNLEGLMLGFMLADFKLQEASDLRKPNDHIRMATEYAVQAFDRYNEIPLAVQNIALEIVSTHHGGDHSHIESKVFKNADALSFLEPKGWLTCFNGLCDDKSESTFSFAFRKVDELFEEKFDLIDLDNDTIAEAKLLKEKYEWFKDRVL